MKQKITTVILPTTSPTTLVSTTTAIKECPVNTISDTLDVEEVITSSNPNEADQVLEPEGWTPATDDTTPSIVLSWKEPDSIMDVIVETEKVDTIQIIVLNDDDVVFDEPFKVQPDDKTVEVNLPNIQKDIVPGNKIKLIITPVSDDVTPVVKNVNVKICRKETTTVIPPTTSPTTVLSTPTETTTVIPPTTSPTTMVSTTTAIEECPVNTISDTLDIEEVITSSNPNEADQVLEPEGWTPATDDTTPSIVLSWKEPDSVMDVILETEKVDTIQIIVLNDDDVVFDEPFKVQPDDKTVEVNLPNIKKDIVPGNKIKLIITPVSDNVTPVVKNVNVKICRKEITTVIPPTTAPTTLLSTTTECMKTALDELTPAMLTVTTDDSANGFSPEDIMRTSGWIADARNPVVVLELNDDDDSPKIYEVGMTVTNVQRIEAELKNVEGVSVITVTQKPKSTGQEPVVLTFNGVIGTEIVIKLVSPLRAEPPIVSDTEVIACIHPKEITTVILPTISSTTLVSTTTAIKECPVNTVSDTLDVEDVVTSSNPTEADQVLEPEGWTPATDDTTPSVVLSWKEPESIMDVIVETEKIDTIQIIVYNDDVVVFDEPFKVQPGDKTVEVNLPTIKNDKVPGNKIELIITPVSDYVTPVVKNVNVKVCRKEITTVMPPSTATTILITTTTEIKECPMNTVSDTLDVEKVITSSNPSEADQVLEPEGWTPATDDTTPSVVLSWKEPDSIMDVIVETEKVDTIQIIVYNDEVVVFDEPFKVQPDEPVEVNLPTIKNDKVPGNKIELIITPVSDYVTPVVKNVKVKVCRKETTTTPVLTTTTECMKTTMDDVSPDLLTVITEDSALGFNSEDIFKTSGWVAKKNKPEITLELSDSNDSPMVYQVVMNVANVQKIEAVLNNVEKEFVKSVTKEPESTSPETVVLMFDGVIGTEIVISLSSSGEQPIVSDVKVVACIHPTELTTAISPTTGTTTLQSTTAIYCQFTQEAFKDNFGYEQIDIVGFVEKDGIEGLSSNSEIIQIDSVIEEGVVVFIGCSNCTCAMDGNIRCDIGQCEECKYTQWSEWTPCSRECDVGARTRERIKLTITNPNICADDLKEMEDCNIEPCVTPTTMPMCEQWSEWNECSSTEACTEGVRSRERHCPDSPSLENEPCVNNCTVPVCEHPLVFITEPTCQLTCYTVQYPESCVIPDDMQPSCGCMEGFVLDEESNICIPIHECQKCYKEDGTAVNPGLSYMKSECEECICTEGLTLTCGIKTDCCAWTEWGHWGECSESCKDGVQNKYRELLVGDPETCGEDKISRECKPPTALPDECIDCIYNDEEYSVGDLVDVRDNGCTKCYCDSTHNSYCVPDPVANVNGSWSEWAEWSSCSSSCDGGVRSRTRLCNDPLPLCDGIECEGRNEEVEDCNAELPCCEISEWSDWSECSATCDDGESVRTRFFVDPSEQNSCDYVNITDIQPCNLGECGCRYSEWSDWTDCNTECGIGLSQRKRDLIQPSSYVECEHSQVEERDCYLADCACDKDHQKWSNHSHCETTCLNRFTNIPVEDCEELNPGCVCEEGYFEDKNGICVTNDNCSVCYHPDSPDEPIEPGKIFKNPNVACEVCQCVGGDIVCNRRCEFPECKEGEVLSYPKTDPCCPRCIPEETTCSLKTEKRVVKRGDCETVDEINVTFCSGSCGNSSSIPVFMMDDGMEYDNMGCIQTCKCCQGTVRGMQTVDIRCGLPGQKRLYKARVPVIVACKCDSCMTTESMKNQVDATSSFGKR
ncbi:uncharacterized protein LOC127727766 [Mytilus californianus]|uniref:uncharacterized protein LOC127727766 n=1 Tax=Mytilus californianus TaxID=6549 RepID=UPI0022460F8F|nr:uncharacterized protein LOC127727766 [Mytilus californianus]